MRTERSESGKSQLLRLLVEIRFYVKGITCYNLKCVYLLVSFCVLTLFNAFSKTLRLLHFVFIFVLCAQCAGCLQHSAIKNFVKIRVKNREPVPTYAMEMDQQERESDIGDESPVVRIFSYLIFYVVGFEKQLSFLTVSPLQ